MRLVILRFTVCIPTLVPRASVYCAPSHLAYRRDSRDTIAYCYLFCANASQSTQPGLWRSNDRVPRLSRSRFTLAAKPTTESLVAFYGLARLGTVVEGHHRLQQHWLNMNYETGVGPRPKFAPSAFVAPSAFISQGGARRGQRCGHRGISHLCTGLYKSSLPSPALLYRPIA